ncbi:hypothetical protein LTR28_009256, partial [Elasticomyces elasticus]
MSWTLLFYSTSYSVCASCALMADLKCLYVTFNCARNLVNAEYFSQCIGSALPADLIVLSLQEIAPIAYSFLGGSFLTSYYDRIAKAVYAAGSKKDTVYEMVLAENVGMTGLMLFAKPRVARRFSRIETSGTGVGLWQMGNKSAVGTRLSYVIESEDEELVLTFVAAHLAPAENA